MKNLILVLLCIVACVAFKDEEVTPANRASVKNAIVIEKKPIKTVAELDAWAETARYNVYNK